MTKIGALWRGSALKVYKVIGILLPSITSYILTGCILFPQWWFVFVYRSGFRKPIYWLGFLEDFSYYPITAWSFLIGVFLVIGVLFYFRDRILKVIERVRLQICIVSTILIIIPMVLVYTSPKDTFILVDLLANSYRIICNLPDPPEPKLQVPIYFYMLDEKIVDELYNQIQPENIEKGSSIKSTNKVGLTGQANAGPAGISAQGSTESNLTTEYSRISALYSRKCVELIQHCLNKGSIKIYTTFGNWATCFMKKNYHDMFFPTLDESGRIDYFRFGLFKSRLIQPNQIEEAFLNEMRRLSGYVLLEKAAYQDADCNILVITSELSTDSQCAKFIVKLPERWKNLKIEHPVLNVRVFGIVVQGLDTHGCIDVRPIAIFQ